MNRKDLPYRTQPHVLVSNLSICAPNNLVPQVTRLLPRKPLLTRMFGLNWVEIQPKACNRPTLGRGGSPVLD